VAVLFVLGGCPWDSDLVRVPVHRLFWISGISPRRQQSSSAPMMRSSANRPHRVAERDLI
jgi:hypothetical protein